MFGKKKSTKERVQVGASEAGQSTEHTGRVKKEKKKGKSINLFRSRTFYGVLCTILGIVIVLVGIPILKAQTTDIITLMVFSSGAEEGTEITADMIQTATMANYNLPEGYVVDEEQVVGQYLTADVIPGDIVTTARVTESHPGDNPELGSIPAGKMALSITLNGMNQSVSSKLRAGDVIRILSYIDSSGAEQNTAEAYVELQYIEVVSVSNDGGQPVVDGADEDSDNMVDTVTVLVTESQARLLVALEHSADVQAALVIRGDAEAKEAALAIQDELLAQLEEQLIEEVIEEVAMEQATENIETEEVE